MVTWNYYTARRIKDVSKFLEQNKCYTYEAFCKVLAERSVECPPEEEVKDILPEAPPPPRKRPRQSKERLAETPKKVAKTKLDVRKNAAAKKVVKPKPAPAPSTKNVTKKTKSN